MRVAVGFVLALAAGCFSRSAEVAPGDDDDGDPAPLTCVTDSDCVGAGSSCCACAEYAVHRDSPFAQACEDLDCPDPIGCSGLEPRCDVDGACVLACAAIPCAPPEPCEAGFAVDAGGCLTCACATAPDPTDSECMFDTDCVQVPADCCGCAQGGADTAVPAADEQEHRDGLACPPAPVCPGVDVCEAGATVTCAAGRCTLAVGGAPMELPDGACGTPELPPCPAGQMCVLNSDAEATLAGVGVCQDP